MTAVARFVKTPKAQLLVIFAILLAIAAPSGGGTSLATNLVAAIVPACLMDGVWMSIAARRVRFPMSALLSAMIVFFILSSRESWLVVAWTSSFPAALALIWAPIAFGSGESWWGALGDLSPAWAPVLLVTGMFLADRLNKFPLVLTFLAVYFGFFSIASVANPHGVAEMFREPFLQAALFLAFFMLTDPPTSPNRYLDQVWFGLLAALSAGVAQLLGAGQVYLLVGLVVPNAVLALVRSARRRGASNSSLVSARAAF